MRRIYYKLWNLWPPFLGSGIVIRSVSHDVRTIVAELKWRRWTHNYVGTQYGGSMFSLTDPFFFVILMYHSKGRWVVWDKAASIRFRRPGRTKLSATFEITKEELEEIHAQVDAEGRINLTRHVQIVDTQGEVVAEVERVIHISLKDRHREPHHKAPPVHKKTSEKPQQDDA